jgi:hypothetical protein
MKIQPQPHSPCFLTPADTDSDAEPAFALVTITEEFRDQVLQQMDELKNKPASASQGGYFPCPLVFGNALNDFYDEENVTPDDQLEAVEELLEANPHSENVNVAPIELQGYRLEGDSYKVYENYIQVFAYIKHTDAELYSGWIMREDLEQIQF